MNYKYFWNNLENPTFYKRWQRFLHKTNQNKSKRNGLYVTFIFLIIIAYFGTSFWVSVALYSSKIDFEDKKKINYEVLLNYWKNNFKKREDVIKYLIFAWYKSKQKQDFKKNDEAIEYILKNLVNSELLNTLNKANNEK